MRAVIVGAGIGGLVAALRLHRVGIACTVYEQSESVRPLGVGLNLLPHAVAELAEIGLLPALDAVALRTAELVYSHRLGQEILRRPCGMGAGFAVPQFSIHRGRLLSVLLHAVQERLGPDNVRTGRRLVGYNQDTDAVVARFDDRRGTSTETATADILIGADGIHSTTRSTLQPTEGPPRWNGVTMWRGATDWHAFDTGRSVIIAGGTVAKLVVYPIAAGTRPNHLLTNWALCIKTGRDADPAPARQDWSRCADPAAVARHLARFRLPYLDHVGLVRSTRECFEFPMCDRDPLPHWSRGRVTLLGDAAHPMYPMGSNGAGQAILDASSLADALAQHTDPVRALVAYENRRLPPTRDVVLRNRAGGPESVIDEVERRAPYGFTRLTDVIDPAELQDRVDAYAHASGADREQLDRQSARSE